MGPHAKAAVALMILGETHPVVLFRCLIGGQLVRGFLLLARDPLARYCVYEICCQPPVQRPAGELG